MSGNSLVSACEQTAEAAQQALAWVTDPKNEPRIGHERAFFERSLRNHAYQARRLAASVQRPMCIGVFGPSQSGKSYLVSVLARKGETLIALFDDPARAEIDFITEINPYGEKEATGLVTRFSIHKVKTPAGFPVSMRLLTQTDVMKILANSYFFDGDQEEERRLSPAEIDSHIAGIESRAGKDYVDVLREEDIWDVEEYFQRQIRKTEAKAFNPYWERMARAAPRLRLRDRAELFSILWGGHQPLTALYVSLVGSLAELGFAEEAFCPIDALVPADKGILNVETLAGLGSASLDVVKVSTSANQVVELPRSVVAALAAELRMVLKENPWPFFDHTDLLDFPGYRSRTLHNLGKYLGEARGALKELFLRGKVDYLFQRYTAEQELTSMLLCLRPSNLDVTTLPAVIEEWIGVTHGRTPEERKARPVLLFFLLTMFDQHLAEKAGDEGADPGMRFQSRMEASLLKPFAKVADSWPLRWAGDAPFQNCYWIRNPNYKAEGVIQYEGRNEVRIHEHKVARIAELRESYQHVAEVREHFRDPLRAFDEVMQLNDGGISYVAENLALVCKPGMKEAQVAARLKDLRRSIVQALSPHFVPTDNDKRLAERQRIAEQVISDFDTCVERQSFGAFLRGLCLDRIRLADALYEACTRGRVEEEPPAKGREPASAGTPSTRSALLDRIKSGGKAESAGQTSASRSRSSRTDLMVRCALELWSRSLHELSDDEDFASFLGVSRNSLKEVATEMIATSRRLTLERAIRVSLDEISHIETAEQAAAKATIVAERHINRFGTSLTVDGELRRITFDAAGIGAHPVNFQNDFVVGWMTAFYEHAKVNALSADGLVHDPEQNALLGRIIQNFEAGRRSDSEET
jgi:hypothetical protein